jgi:cytochrome c
MSRRGVVVGIWIAAMLSTKLSAAESSDERMDHLARDSGCYLCHQLSPSPPAYLEVLPPAPAWTDVAQKYRKQKGAEEQLTKTVLKGTGSEPGDRHWAGQARNAQMYANNLEISPADAKSLVHWILTLTPNTAFVKSHIRK